MGKLRLLRTKQSMDKNYKDMLEKATLAPKSWIKNTCWYCNEPLDNTRRYCDKGCAEAFEEDDSAMARCMSEKRLQLSA
jgi:hypothetical protein